MFSAFTSFSAFQNYMISQGVGLIYPSCGVLLPFTKWSDEANWSDTEV